MLDTNSLNEQEVCKVRPAVWISRSSRGAWQDRARANLKQCTQHRGGSRTATAVDGVSAARKIRLREKPYPLSQTIKGAVSAFERLSKYQKNISRSFPRGTVPVHCGAPASQRVSFCLMTDGSPLGCKRPPLASSLPGDRRNCAGFPWRAVARAW